MKMKVINEFDVEGFDYDKFTCKYEELKFSAVLEKYIIDLEELVKDSRSAYLMACIYPIDAIKEYLKYLVYEKNISGVKAREFEIKYLYTGNGFPIYKLIALFGEEKYYQMLDELKVLAESK